VPCGQTGIGRESENHNFYAHAFFEFFTISLILRKNNPAGCADLHLCENPWGEQMV